MARTTTIPTTTQQADGREQEQVLLPQRPELNLPVFRVVVYIFLTLGAMVFVLPFLWMVSTSLMNMNEIARGIFVTESDLLGIHPVSEEDMSRRMSHFIPAELEIVFNGDAATLLYDAGPDGGAVDVFIDDQRIGTLDTYSKEKQPNQRFVVDSYPSVPTLSASQEVQLIGGRHILTLAYNEAASRGKQLFIHGVQVASDGEETNFISAAEDGANKKFGAWAGLARRGDMQIWVDYNDDEGEWRYEDGSVVDPANIILVRSTNYPFPEYFASNIRNSMPTSTSRIKTQREYIDERQNGGYATLSVDMLGIEQQYVLNGGVSHYLQVWKGSGGNSAGFDEFFVNSAIITFLTIFGQTLFSIMAAYAFARMKFPGSNILFILFLTTLFIPFMVILIPNYLTVVDINDWFIDNVGPAFDDLGQYPPFEWIGLDATDAAWIDNWPSLVIPFLASTFSIFLLRQFFIQIPTDLWDAARIDGAGHILFLFRVVVPISRAAIVTVVLFTFIGTWDQLEWPILVTRTDEWRPISYALYDFQSTEGARPNLLMAGAVIALFPVVLVYLIAQKQFTEGIATTGLKG